MKTISPPRHDPNHRRTNEQFDWLDRIASGLAIVTALAGGLRVLFVRPLSDALNDDTLKFFAVAGGLLLLRKVKSISFGDTKVEMQDLKDEVANLSGKADEALEEAKTATSMAQHTSVPASPANLATAMAAPLAAAHFMTAPSSAPPPAPSSPWDREPGAKRRDDPWYGAFGGKAEDRNRRLRAEVSPVRGEEDWFRLRLWVESVDPEKHPLNGRVRFFIHDTFPENRPFVRVAGGVAELRLKAWGAFTVGALADEGQTQLELDLAEVKSFPRRFRDR